MTEQSRSERFAELCAEMATRLNLAPDAERVRHIATLRMMHEVLTIRFVAGHDVDANFANAMLKTAEMLQPLLPSIDPAASHAQGYRNLYPLRCDVSCGGTGTRARRQTAAHD